MKFITSLLFLFSFLLVFGGKPMGIGVGIEKSNLSYLDPDITGKVIYSNLIFIESNSSEIDEVLQVVTDVNFKKVNRTIVYNKFTIVKSHDGLKTAYIS